MTLPQKNSESNHAAMQELHLDAEQSSARKRDRQRVLVLLCTFNEMGNIAAMIDRLQAALPDSDQLVVDDASPDGTGQWVAQRASEDARVHLLQRSGKLGLGSATRLGMKWSIEHQYDFLINLDADLSHRPEDAPKLLQACQQNFDVAVASRYLDGGGFTNIAMHRRLMSWLLNRYANRLLGLPLTDCSGSFRCYRIETLAKLDWSYLTCDGYGFLEEILVALHGLGSKFTEVPIWFDARNLGKSKLSWADAWGAIRVIQRLRR